MVKYKHPKKTNRLCSKCGSPLLLIEEKTEIVEGQYTPVTTTVYECSDKACQEDSDKKAVLRTQLLKEQEKARKKRLDSMRENRRKAMKAKKR